MKVLLLLLSSFVSSFVVHPGQYEYGWWGTCFFISDSYCFGICPVVTNNLIVSMCSCSSSYPFLCSARVRESQSSYWRSSKYHPVSVTYVFRFFPVLSKVWLLLGCFFACFSLFLIVLVCIRFSKKTAGLVNNNPLSCLMFSGLAYYLIAFIYCEGLFSLTLSAIVLFVYL